MLGEAQELGLRFVYVRIKTTHSSVTGHPRLNTLRSQQDQAKETCKKKSCFKPWNMNPWLNDLKHGYGSQFLKLRSCRNLSLPGH